MAIGRIAPRIDIADLEAGGNLGAGADQAAQDAVDGGSNCLGADLADDVTFGYLVADLPIGGEGAISLARSTRSLVKPPILPGMPVLASAWPAAINRPRLCPRLVSTTTWQSVPAVKPGPRAITSGASVMAVPDCAWQWCVDEDVGLQATHRVSFRIDHDGDHSLFPGLSKPCAVFNLYRFNPFHRLLPVVDSFAERDLPAYRQGKRSFQHEQAAES
ncbi:hypothetical protein [Geotalea toluenoxydans]|uniref:hypothetical protein n=1 Tax=Geotalea toluenoxydans TaxID=421624 RepID=UPI0006D06C7A|nr:hypothetical protein [Geotalea toluenoxydans]